MDCTEGEDSVFDVRAGHRPRWTRVVQRLQDGGAAGEAAPRVPRHLPAHRRRESANAYPT